MFLNFVTAIFFISNIDQFFKHILFLSFSCHILEVENISFNKTIGPTLTVNMQEMSLAVISFWSTSHSHK